MKERFCQHCGLRWINKDETLCFICRLKKRKWYKWALKEFQEQYKYRPAASTVLFPDGLWNFEAHANRLWKRYLFIGMMLASLHNPHLNESPKVPNTKRTDYFSEWELSEIRRYNKKAGFGELK